MEEVKNDFIKKYKFLNYYIYIKEAKEYYEAYLQHEKYGVISLMFGSLKEASDLQGFISDIYNNICKYIELYRESYED